jgi:hypothetical protein
MANKKATRITYPTRIVNAHRIDAQGNRVSNGGWHKNGKRAYRKACLTLTNCLLTYKRPRLFHVCFKGGTYAQHKALLEKLVDKLDRKGIPCEWWGAREVDGMEHLHIFLIVDSNDVQAQSILNTYEDQYLSKEATKLSIKVWINAPQAAVHEERRFVELPWLGSSRDTSPEAMARLEDALVWMTYPFKARGKPENAKDGQMFPASRPSRKRAYEPEHDMPVQRHPRVLAATQQKALH